MQYVYVLSKHGEPLMPCSPGKARLLLKEKKARVVRRTPFTIKLLYGSAGYKQPITLGVDAGSKHVGLSASTKNVNYTAKSLLLATMWLSYFLSANSTVVQDVIEKPVTAHPDSIIAFIVSTKVGLRHR